MSTPHTQLPDYEFHRGQADELEFRNRFVFAVTAHYTPHIVLRCGTLMSAGQTYEPLDTAARYTAARQALKRVCTIFCVGLALWFSADLMVTTSWSLVHGGEGDAQPASTEFHQNCITQSSRGTDAEELQMLHTLAQEYRLDETAGTTAPVTIVVLCVPGSAKWVRMCEAVRTNRADYVKRHGYGLRLFTKLPTTTLHRSMPWHTLAATFSALLTPGVEFAFKMDADSLLMDPTIPLDGLLPHANQDVSVSSTVHKTFPGSHRASPERNIVNNGHFIWRASEWGRAKLEDIWLTYPPPVDVVRRGKTEGCLDDTDQRAYVASLIGHPVSCSVELVGESCNRSGLVKYDERVRLLPNNVFNAWPPAEDELVQLCTLGDNGAALAGAGRIANLDGPLPVPDAFRPAPYQLRSPPFELVLHFSHPAVTQGPFRSEDVLDVFERCAAWAAARPSPAPQAAGV